MDQKRTWIYCRVAHSGPDSTELLEGQRLRLESYAGEHGFEIIASSNDTGSGLTLDRPGLLAFLDAVDNEAVDVLLLMDLARLGRDMDQVFRYWQRLRERGVHIYTVMDGEIDMGICAMLQEIAGK